MDKSIWEIKMGIMLEMSWEYSMGKSIWETNHKGYNLFAQSVNIENGLYDDGCTHLNKKFQKEKRVHKYLEC